MRKAALWLIVTRSAVTSLLELCWRFAEAAFSESIELRVTEVSRGGFFAGLGCFFTVGMPFSHSLQKNAPPCLEAQAQRSRL